MRCRGEKTTWPFWNCTSGHCFPGRRVPSSMRSRGPVTSRRKPFVLDDRAPGPREGGRLRNRRTEKVRAHHEQERRRKSLPHAVDERKHQGLLLLI